MYEDFASVYDLLMEDVDYKGWARFYRELLCCYGVRRGNVCECACGTGSITLELSRLGYYMTGVDLSTEMLFIAGTRARAAAAVISMVHQDMRKLNLHHPVNAVLCSNDGLNYLPTEEDLFAFFKAAYNSLQPGGAIVFDLSTPYKLTNILGNNFIGDETEKYAYLWKNTLHEKKRCVDLDLAVFVRDQGNQYHRVEEHQTQYMHEADELVIQLQRAGFRNVCQWGDKRLEKPREDEERWFFAGQKPVSENP